MYVLEALMVELMLVRFSSSDFSNTEDVKFE